VIQDDSVIYHTNKQSVFLLLDFFNNPDGFFI